MAESTGDASVAMYNLDRISNKNAFGDWEFCMDRIRVADMIFHESYTQHRRRSVVLRGMVESR